MPQGTILRGIAHDLPRRFLGLPRARQAEVLADPPPLTRTRWDALLAAVAEHVAELHGHSVPAWADEPARFLRVPWIVSADPEIRANSLLYAPPAFIRHGALPDPRDFDARGGERHAWDPEP